MLLILALALAAACSHPPASPPAAAEPARPAVPPEVLAPAQAVLGSDAEVLLHGDLARNGRRQVLAIHRVKSTPKGAVPGTLVLRAAVLEFDAGRWREVFRCDDHLKNPQGFLGATPIAPVTGWRLQYEEDAERGLVMYFTPLTQPAGSYILTIGVRWNPRVKRYQSLDRNFEKFLGETPALGKIESQLRQ
jgi:hypothetical protein